jgi:phospholipid/cholesterol/gamma-HCH transport system substrate-binding protein
VISRRVYVNLAAFFALFVLLATWAIRNVVRLDAIERPYTIVAEFASSPGLQANVEASYLGVPVGTIDDVRLVGDRVRVRIDIDRDVRLPEGLSAAVRRRSAVGEPYVALDPPPTAGATSATIEPGDDYVIPLERTSIPLSYGELFASVDELVRAIPADELGIVLDELATALEGRGPALRRIIESGDDLTTTLAERTELLDDLAGDLTALTATLTDRRGEIGSAFGDLAALTTTLAERRADIDRLLANAPDLGRDLNQLVEATYADLSCAFGDLGVVFTEIGTPERIDDLLRLLRQAAGARDSLDAALVEPGEGGADGPYLGGSFGLVADDAPPSYPAFPSLPVPPALAACTDPGAATDPVPEDAEAAVPGAGGVPGSPDRLEVGERPVPAGPDLDASTDLDVDEQPFPLATLLTVLAAALALALIAGVRPWRWRPFASGAGSEPDDDDPLD